MNLTDAVSTPAKRGDAAYPASIITVRDPRQKCVNSKSDGEVKD
jgi:hypothetical protein